MKLSVDLSALAGDLGLAPGDWLTDPKFVVAVDGLAEGRGRPVEDLVTVDERRQVLGDPALRSAVLAVAGLDEEGRPMVAW